MADFPALPLFTDAYLGDTQHLTLEEHGAYLKLLIIAWRSPDCSLPDDDKRLAIMLGISERKWKQSLRKVLHDFFEVGEGKWIQKRLRKERNYVEESRAQKSRAGKASARKRNKTGSTRVTTGKPTDAQREGQQKASNPHPHPLKAPLPPNGSDANPPPAAIDSDVVQATHDQLVEIAGADPVKAPSWMHSSMVRSWMAEGIAPETILDAARDVMARGNAEPNGPVYFSKPVRERHAALEAEAEKETRQLAAFDGGRADRIARLRDFCGETGHEGFWRPNWGDKPTVDEAQAELARLTDERKSA